jgi:hypothetical protein
LPRVTRSAVATVRAAWGSPSFSAAVTCRPHCAYEQGIEREGESIAEREIAGQRGRVRKTKARKMKSERSARERERESERKREREGEGGRDTKSALLDIPANIAAALTYVAATTPAAHTPTAPAMPP